MRNLIKINIFTRKIAWLSIILAYTASMCFYSPIAKAINADTIDTSPSISLQKPNLNNAQIILWSDKAVETIFSYDYLNLEQSLQAASTYFTPAAWKKFQTALTMSGNIQIIVKNKIKTEVTLTDPGRIKEQKVEFGRYGWRVQIPVDLTYIDTITNSIIKTEHLITTLHIIRVPVQVNPHGIAIHSINYYYIF